MPENQSNFSLPPEIYADVDYVHSQYKHLAAVALKVAEGSSSSEVARWDSVAGQCEKTADTVGDLKEQAAEARYSDPPLLKEHQREVLQLIAQGHTQYEVAGELNLSVGTVSSRIVALRRKVGINDLLELVEHFAGAGEIDFTEEDKEALQKRLKSHPQPKQPKKPRTHGEMLDEPMLKITPEHRKKIEALFRSDVARMLDWLLKRVRFITDDKNQTLENFEMLEINDEDLLGILQERGIITPEEYKAKKINRQAYIAAIIIKAEQRNPDKYQGLFLSGKTVAKSMRIIAEEEEKFIKEENDRKQRI
jgi:DNA-binding CsgD family transcriptional regulator